MFEELTFGDKQPLIILKFYILYISSWNNNINGLYFDCSKMKMTNLEMYN